MTRGGETVGGTSIMGLMMLAAGPGTTISVEATGAEAAAVVDAFHAALHRGDSAGAAALLSEDAVIFEEGHVEYGKAEYAKHHLPADAAFSKAVTSTVVRRTGGGDAGTAWLASEGRTKGIFKGKAVNSMTTETMMLRQAESSWKIVHVHWSSHSMKGD